MASWGRRSHSKQSIQVQASVKYGYYLDYALGRHPVTGVDVVIHLQHCGATIRSETIIGGTQRHCVTKLEPQNEVLTFTFDQAVALLDRVGNR
jgi:hypothetical protein